MDVKIVDIDDVDYRKHLKQINVDYAWKYTKGENVKIVSIDSGVSKHNDLTKSFTRGINMFNRTDDVSDDYSHGTSVAGLLCGSKTGVSPNSELYIIKALDSSGVGGMDVVNSGISFARGLKADVLCLSLGVKNSLPISIQQSIIRARESGVTIVSAVGNSSSNKPEYPAYMKEVIGVGGMNDSFKLSEFSNYGYEMDLIAPSTEIITTHMNGGYCMSSGTSMASPIVSGGIALIISYMKSLNLDTSPDSVRNLILNSYDNNHNILTGYGAFDLERIFKNIRM